MEKKIKMSFSEYERLTDKIDELTELLEDKTFIVYSEYGYLMHYYSTTDSTREIANTLKKLETEITDIKSKWYFRLFG